MSARVFLDTNILVYTFDRSALVKQKKALSLVGEALEDGTGLISYQVVQEFINVATRKFPSRLTPEDLRLYIRSILLPLCEVPSSAELFRRAVDIHHEGGVAFYDALIIAGAEEAGCRILYSEDLQSGRRFGPVRIVNPFL